MWPLISKRTNKEKTAAMTTSKRILIRSGKDPFRIVSAENTLQSNLIGNNSGNLLFSTAATRILSTPGTKIVANGLGPNPEDADAINEQYDAVVLPFANALRVPFEGRLRRFTELIERLTIPVTVLGCGTQADLDYGTERLEPIRETVQGFMRAVLNRSAAVGVRGEFTASYLKSLGFSDVEVVGCPSMFLFGGSFQIKKPDWPGRDAAIVVNASSSNASLLGDVIRENAERYPNLVYVAQDKRELEQLLWGQSVEVVARGSEFPSNVGHPLYAQDRVRFFLDPAAWIDWMRDREFSFGTRIHGNLIALLAGTPAYVLAHDSRTLELARYFEIPHRPIRTSADVPPVESMFEEADYNRFEAGQPERVRRMASFLERNGLEHTLVDDAGGLEFESRLRATQYPLAVGPTMHAEPAEILHRVRWLRSRHQKKFDALEQRVADLERRFTT